MDRIMVKVEINGFSFTNTIKLTDFWQRIKIPMISAGTYSKAGDFIVSITAGDQVLDEFGTSGSEFIVIGEKEKFMIGRRSIYHATGPVPYSAQ